MSLENFDGHIWMKLAEWGYYLVVVPVVWLWRKITGLELKLASEYIHKDDYKEELKSLHIKFDSMMAKQDSQYEKLIDKLDAKVDK